MTQTRCVKIMSCEKKRPALKPKMSGKVSSAGAAPIDPEAPWTKPETLSGGCARSKAG